jgi:hypothetical protein
VVLRCPVALCCCLVLLLLASALCFVCCILFLFVSVVYDSLIRYVVNILFDEFNFIKSCSISFTDP